MVQQGRLLSILPLADWNTRKAGCCKSLHNFTQPSSHARWSIRIFDNFVSLFSVKGFSDVRCVHCLLFLSLTAFIFVVACPVRKTNEVFHILGSPTLAAYDVCSWSALTSFGFTDQVEHIRLQVPVVRAPAGVDPVTHVRRCIVGGNALQFYFGCICS